MSTAIDQLAGEGLVDTDALSARPGFASFLREAFSLFRWRMAHDGFIVLAKSHDGGGQPVLLVPGFFSSDLSMNVLQKTLEACNYQVFGWKMGVNLGASAERLAHLTARLAAIYAMTGRPVSLIGWSLGGVMAREVAKCRPEIVDRVITLGSPFSGDPHANRVWRLYEFIAGHKVDEPPVPCSVEEKPPVPTIALWSRRDGVVAARCARGRPGERDRAIEVDSTHLGLVSAPQSLAATLAALDL